MKRAFIEPYAKFILNINLFREIILVELRVNEVSQCRRSHQRVGHVSKRERWSSGQSAPKTLVLGAESASCRMTRIVGQIQILHDLGDFLEP